MENGNNQTFRSRSISDKILDPTFFNFSIFDFENGKPTLIFGFLDH
jgi:adenine specific DNA methylase Mod